MIEKIGDLFSGALFVGVPLGIFLSIKLTQHLLKKKHIPGYLFGLVILPPDGNPEEVKKEPPQKAIDEG